MLCDKQSVYVRTQQDCYKRIHKHEWSKIEFLREDLPPLRRSDKSCRRHLNNVSLSQRMGLESGRWGRFQTHDNERGRAEFCEEMLDTSGLLHCKGVSGRWVRRQWARVRSICLWTIKRWVSLFVTIKLRLLRHLQKWVDVIIIMEDVFLNGGAHNLRMTLEIGIRKKKKFFSRLSDNETK